MRARKRTDVDVSRVKSSLTPERDNVTLLRIGVVLAAVALYLALGMLIRIAVLVLATLVGFDVPGYYEPASWWSWILAVAYWGGLLVVAWWVGFRLPRWRR
jgi:hypothetical protein